MVLSMTGFGRSEAVINGRSIAVELHSVNARYFEYSSRIPRSCSFAEDKLKKLVGQRISRGKVELSVTLQSMDATDVQINVNTALAEQYYEALRLLSEKLQVKNDATASLLAHFPDVISVAHAPTDEEALWQDIAQVAQQAIEQFLQMRAAEGAKLKEDVLQKLDSLESYVTQIEQGSEGRVEAYTEKLYAKLKLLLEDRELDDARLLTEAALFADKTAIDEETVRLRSHIAQYREILNANEPVGRKLDFLTQEMNREVNTIGSKCQNVELTKLVVAAKSEIEKIREQIQNLE